MTRIKRPQPAPSWMDGYRPHPSVEAACQALEDRLREGPPQLFPDAPRVQPEIDGWGL